MINNSMFRCVICSFSLKYSCFSFPAKVFSRCEFAQEIVYVHGFPQSEAADWVCLAEHESSLNTGATNHNTNGSDDYGIFQVRKKGPSERTVRFATLILRCGRLSPGPPPADLQRRPGGHPHLPQGVPQPHGLPRLQAQVR